jgi:hypothetical protein
MNRRSILVLLCTLVATACGTADRPADPVPAVEIPFREDGRLTFHRDGTPVVDIAVEIADTDSARARGLMQRTRMPDRSGMLFVFPVEQPQSFWMANTPIYLDLMFLDSAGRIVSIARSARPLSTEPVPSGLPAQYVIETEAGFVDSWGVVEGDSASWSRSPE